MKQKLFQLFDRTAEMVSGPIMAFNREAPAIREFHAVLEMGDKSQPGRYPEQFELLMIGEQDTDTGALTSCTPEKVTDGQEWLDSRERDKLIAQARARHSEESEHPRSVGLR